MPPGTIIAWIDNTPPEPESDWVLCNGENGTPDLSGVFLRGGDSSTTQPRGTTNQITLTSDHLPKHRHAVTIDMPGVYTRWNGAGDNELLYRRPSSETETWSEVNPPDYTVTTLELEVDPEVEPEAALSAQPVTPELPMRRGVDFYMKLDSKPAK